MRLKNKALVIKFTVGFIVGAIAVSAIILLK